MPTVNKILTMYQKTSIRTKEVGLIKF